MKIRNIIILCASVLVTTSCSDWLEVLPNNEQVTATYWQSKEDVEAVLASAYAKMREQTQTIIDWSELRGSSIYAYSGSSRQKLQNFQLTSADALCKWGGFYSVLNYANSVIKYAPIVSERDETYHNVYMKSHLVEAYFLRDLSLFYLLRNFKEVPLVTEPYVDDSAPYDLPKASEDKIIAQIKKDLQDAIGLGVAKEVHIDDEWSGATKGRVTKWALFALMADVCLWNEDYDECIAYCDSILLSQSPYRPAFMSDGDKWFEIFYPGNSNESIFELNWQGTGGYSQTTYSPSNYFTVSTSAVYQYTSAMRDRFKTESLWHSEDPINHPSVRAEFGAYVDLQSESEQYCIWKYQGIGYNEKAQQRSSKDANLIVYRVAEILLMKAEALVWRGHYEEALELINRVRERSGLYPLDIIENEQDGLQAILYERDIEFAGECKRWYDLVRFGRSKQYRYRSEFVNIILNNNETANPTWLTSVLQNDYAWYLPIYETELDANRLLVQNPYYGGEKTK